jgi:putative Holliday junction resolvase
MSCYLGLDYGLRRIGIAASDPAASLAFALETHVEGRDGSILSRLGALIAERSAATVVLGLPLTADGREGDMVVKVRKFADRLRREFEVEVVLWDERFSSAEADRWLEKGTRFKREDRDAVAAQIILQSYLDSLKSDALPRGDELD